MSVDAAWFADEPDLAGADARHLAVLARAGRAVALRSGETLVDAGEHPREVFWVAHGYLHAGRRTGGATTRFGGHGSGVWGLRDALLGSPRRHRVWATDDSEVIAVPVETFLGLLGRAPELLARQIRFAVGTLRSEGVIAAAEVDLDLPRRLCRLLLVEFTHGHHVDIPVRRDALARMLKVSRPELSTAVSRLVRRGLFAPAGRGSLTVVDRAAAEAFGRGPAPAPRRDPLLPQGARPPAHLDVPAAPFTTGLDLRATTVRRLEPGTVVARRDSTVEEVHVVLDGTLSMRAPTRSGGLRLTDARPGPAVLGAGALVGGTGWPVELVAVAPTTVLSVPPEVARAQLAAPAAQWALLRHAARHLTESSAVRADGVAISPRARLARLLLERTDTDGAVRVATSGADLAAELGTSRQSVSSAVSGLRADGVLTGDTRRGLVVTDRPGLIAAADLTPTAPVSATRHAEHDRSAAS